MIAQVIAAAALAAAPAPLLDAARAQDLAVAGDEVVVTRPGRSGRLHVDAVAVDGSGVRSLLATRRLGPRWSSSGLVFASPQSVAVIASWEKHVKHGPNRFSQRLYIGPRAGPLQRVTGVGGPDTHGGWVPLGAAVDGDRVLVAEARLTTLPQRSRLRLYEPGAQPRRLPWGDEVAPPLALAGEHVAFSLFGSVFRLVVADLETGRRQVSMNVFDPFEVDVTGDGTVLGDGTIGLVTAAPGRPRSRVRGGSFLSGGRFAGTSIVAIEFEDDGAERPVVLDPGASRPRPVGVSTRDLLVLDADQAGVGWIANGCVLYAPVTAAAPAEPPAGPCPRVELRFFERDKTLRGRRLRVDVDCVAAPAAGCNGAVVLRIGGISSRARFHVRPGRQRAVTVRLARRAAQLVRRQVQRRGHAELKLAWRVRDSRASRFPTPFVVDQVS